MILLVLPDIRYVRCGDGYVACQVIGDGPTDLLVIFADVTHIEHGWREPGSARFLGRLADAMRVVQFDKRGFGLSDPLTGRPTLADRMGEITAVLDAVGSERVALFGLWEGAHMAIRYAIEHRERVTSLVIYGSAARNIWAPDYEFQPDRATREAGLIYSIEHWGDTG